MEQSHQLKSEKIDLLVNPLGAFIRGESSSGILLFACAVIAMLWANSPWSHSYHEFWQSEISISFGRYSLNKSLHFWINDGLMAMFFFVVGLELKREIIGGELSSADKALLPVAAAVGGMLFPALIFLGFNPTSPANSGWGIPVATDIAFVLGILSLLGKRVPVSLKVFLTALAIADDLGAVLVIALFYTSNISFTNLATGICFLATLLAGNYLGVRNFIFYGVVGIGGLWLAFVMSGVHPTIAGVLGAMAIPARTRIDEGPFTRSLRNHVDEFTKVPPNKLELLEPAQMHVIQKIRKLIRSADTPLQRLEYYLLPVITFGVMPLFALANAGITIDESLWEVIVHPVFFGTFFGLVLGKPTGIMIVAGALTAFGFSRLPSGVTWRHLLGVSFLAGVGFTMSLFIANLAYGSGLLTVEARFGVLAASVVSGVVGFLVLRSCAPNHSS
jgi:NhaA family Na+:H+ antiporter